MKYYTEDRLRKGVAEGMASEMITAEGRQVSGSGNIAPVSAPAILDGVEISTGGIEIRLDGFQGPLELLLHLIKENKMKIAEIQVSVILDQYLDFLKIVTDLNVDNAGDFLLMAAQLAYIKSRSLLPIEEQPEELDEGDPREQLIQQLLEYEKFKRVADSLIERDILNRDVFVKGTEEAPPPRGENDFEEVSVFKLLEIFDGIIKNAPKEVVHEVIAEKISVSRRVLEILDNLKLKGTLSVLEVFIPGSTKQALIVSLLAILELGKHHLIRIYQSALYGDVQIVGNNENLETTDTGTMFEGLD